MHHFARRTAGYTAALATTALLLASGCGSDDDKDKDSAPAMTTTSAAMNHDEEHLSGASAETKIATQGGTEVTVSGEIYDKYVQTGGPTGPLGAPLEAQESGPEGGEYQDFTGGTIYWSKDSGAHIVWGEIRKAWEDNGGANGTLGYPISDETEITGGKQSDFTGGTITWVDEQTTVTHK